MMAAALCACAQAPTRNLAPGGRALHSLRVYVWDGNGGALPEPARTAFVATLGRSGLEVRSVGVLARPFDNAQALMRAWDAEPQPEGGPDHALVLTRQYEQSYGGVRYVRYEAVLWDAQARSLVWQGKLAAAFQARPRVLEEPKLVLAPQQAERLAGDLLRGLDRDGHLSLRGLAPRDGKGDEIPATFLPLQLL